MENGELSFLNSRPLRVERNEMHSLSQYDRTPAGFGSRSYDIRNGTSLFRSECLRREHQVPTEHEGKELGRSYDQYGRYQIEPIRSENDPA
jgi:hypothetical protein